MSADVSTASVEQLQQQLVDCQRQAILGSLSGTIAHEYNNLMMPVLERAKDAVARDDVAAMRKALTITVRQTEKALRFTQRVLELARGEALPMKACRVAELVDHAIAATVRPFEKDGIRLELQIPEGLHIRAQPLLFVQVLLNLFLNARQAMKDHCGTLRISACADGDVVVIAVSDTGRGMSPEMLNDVVNAFLAAKANARLGDGGGVGLGLTVCRTIAQQHGATIRARADDGGGCTFELRWPAV